MSLKNEGIIIKKIASSLDKMYPMGMSDDAGIHTCIDP